MLRKVNKENSPGINLFAFLLILASYNKLIGFLNFSYYRFMFQGLSEDMQLARYIFSVTLRIVGIIVGIGLLYRKELFRKVFLVLCLATVISLPFKHPFSVFKNIAIYREYQQGINILPEGTKTANLKYPVFPKGLKDYTLKFPSFPFISMASFMAVDAVFAIAGILFFRLPRVKKCFEGK
ncbi:MAG: hypothetical protein HQL27_01580 [Candidatus Omnitrophica bacterium]|nr:hypothetical protein [Candidatus Omnitrophota bacterium]